MLHVEIMFTWHTFFLQREICTLKCMPQSLTDRSLSVQRSRKLFRDSGMDCNSKILSEQFHNKMFKGEKPKSVLKSVSSDHFQVQ